MQGRIRDQLKLCQEQIALGQRWGQKVDKFIAGDLVSVGDFGDESEVLIKADSSLRNDTQSFVDDLLDEATGGTAISEPATNSSEEVDAFLSSPLEKIDHAKVAELDLDALLDDFT